VASINEEFMPTFVKIYELAQSLKQGTYRAVILFLSSSLLQEKYMIKLSLLLE
jgi:hypothetical protein